MVFLLEARYGLDTKSGCYRVIMRNRFARSESVLGLYIPNKAQALDLIEYVREITKELFFATIRTTVGGMLRPKFLGKPYRASMGSTLLCLAFLRPKIFVRANLQPGRMLKESCS